MERCPYCFKTLPENGICDCRYEESENARIEDTLHPGAVIGAAYQIGAVLGKGGFGITYRGFDLNMERIVAIKEFYPDGMVTRGRLVSEFSRSRSAVVTLTERNKDIYKKSLELFYREAKALSKLDKLPNVVHAHHIFRENGTAYIVMEFVEGKSLKQMILEQGRIPETELITLLDPALIALSKVHEAEILHRDIAPDNIMIENGQPILIDFGAARVEEGHASSLLIGKKGYSSPEQMAGGAMDARSDIYSIGATYYKALTGVTPQDSVLRTLGDQVKPLKELAPEVSQHVSDAVMKAMAVKPEDRFTDAAAFRQALNEKPTTAVQPPSTGSGNGNGSGSVIVDAKPPKKKPKAAIIAAAILAVLAGGFFLFRKQIIPPPVPSLPVSDQEMTMTAIAAYKETSTAAVIQTETQRVIDAELTRIAGDQATETDTPIPTNTPQPTETDTPIPTNTPKPTSTPRPTATKTRVPTETETYTPTMTLKPGGPQIYTVEEGDNCWSIAVDKFGVDFELFMLINNMTDCTINIGDQVIIPGADQKIPTMVPTETKIPTMVPTETKTPTPKPTNTKIPTATPDLDFDIENGVLKRYKGNDSQVKIPDGITRVDKMAFYNNKKIVSVYLPNTITSIGYSAFEYCSNIKDITIPSSVTTIEDYAFNHCDSLTSVTIPDSVTSLGQDAFSFCKNLRSVTISSNLSSFGNRAFYSCQNLSSVTIRNGVPTIPDDAFSMCTSLRSISIPNSVTSIGADAFDSCESLNSVTIPGSVAKIGDCAFWRCTNLTNVTIQNGVKTIGSEAFGVCANLSSVILPESVSYIGSFAFSRSFFDDTKIRITAPKYSYAEQWCKQQYDTQCINN